MRFVKMTMERKPVLALFYCRNTPGSSEHERQALEKEFAGSIRLFPIPCGGRLESLHLLRALEEFADAAYVITCPEGTCRYFDGNMMARRRVEHARSIIASIGLEEGRLGIVVGSADREKSLAVMAGEIMEEISSFRPSPVLEKAG